MTGLVSARSATGVEQTVAAIRAEAERRGATVAAVVDHAAAARTVGLTLPDTQVIIFGNPSAGTPLMRATPDIALDLPLRILVRDDGQPGSEILWQDPDYVAARFGLTGDHLGPLRTPGALVTAVLDQQ
ncbi:MAG TPA: DUF302 domain-containing protein [Micromonosporaceae bacterium]|jgi:uncharacterized protein (DUF302 family)